MKKVIFNSTIYKNVRYLRLDLSVIFLISFSTILLIDLWLVNIAEIFNGGERIGQIIYKLCLAYVSAFIFYFLVVHTKNQKDKENLYGYISNKTLNVIGQAKMLINDCAKAANVTLSNSYPDFNELHNICININPNANAPLLLGQMGNNANWIQYFEYIRRRSNHSTDRILSKMQFLDSELVIILSKIEDCSHFNMVSNLIGVIKMPIKNNDLLIFESGLADYINLVKDLENYYNRKLKIYQ